ncbi:hypothetical protein HYW74_02555 [Candidatus Pacearchaeota archaeon]|nr:hypothetical protein [Candidatus Pacearchaeota archaeon]
METQRGVLYEDDRLKVTYLHSPEPGEQAKIISAEDHELWIKLDGNEWGNYIIPRGILDEIATTKGLKKIERIFNTFNPDLMHHLRNQRLTTADVALAMAQAKISELEYKVDYFIDEARRAREERLDREEE